MGYQHVWIDSSPRQPFNPFSIWQCSFCRVLLVLHSTYEKPPAACGVCKR